MKYFVEISEATDHDLREIFEYIAIVLQSPDNATGQINRLNKAILSLDHMPHRYRAYEGPGWEKRGLRVMPVDNYCVFYVCDDRKDIVTITRVIYGARDIPEIL